MGINDLPSQFKALGLTIELGPQELRDKVVGVDGFVYIHSALSICAKSEEFARRFHAVGKVPFGKALQVQWDRMLALLTDLGAKVVIVLDGHRNPIKREEDSNRNTVVQKSLTHLEDYMRKGTPQGTKKLEKLGEEACHASREVVAYFVEWARTKNLRLIGAPYEGEHQLVQLQLQEEIHWIYSVDSDCLPNGATKVIYEVTRGNNRVVAKAFTSELVKKFMLDKFGNYTHHDFVAYCVFLGCDYCKRIRGCGPQFLNEHFIHWVEKNDNEKKGFLLDIEEFGCAAWVAAKRGTLDIAPGTKVVKTPGFSNNFHRAYLALYDPLICDVKLNVSDAAPLPVLRWHRFVKSVDPGWLDRTLTEDDHIKDNFDKDSKMSSEYLTVQKWIREGDSDPLSWLPQPLEIRGQVVKGAMVYELPEYVKAKWYWRKSIFDYLILRGFKIVETNTTDDELDGMIARVRAEGERLPMVMPQHFNEDFVVAVGDIIKPESKAKVTDFAAFKSHVQEKIPPLDNNIFLTYFGNYTSAYERILFEAFGGHVANNMTMFTAVDHDNRQLVVVQVNVLASMKKKEYDCRLIFASPPSDAAASEAPPVYTLLRQPHTYCNCAAGQDLCAHVGAAMVILLAVQRMNSLTSWQHFKELTPEPVQGLRALPIPVEYAYPVEGKGFNRIFKDATNAKLLEDDSPQEPDTPADEPSEKEIKVDVVSKAMTFFDSRWEEMQKRDSILQKINAAKTTEGDNKDEEVQQYMKELEEETKLTHVREQVERAIKEAHERNGVDGNWEDKLEQAELMLRLQNLHEKGRIKKSNILVGGYTGPMKKYFEKIVEDLTPKREEAKEEARTKEKSKGISRKKKK